MYEYICPDCGEIYSSDYEMHFCSQCGAKLNERKFYKVCPNCNTKFDVEAYRYCPYCKSTLICNED